MKKIRVKITLDTVTERTISVLRGMLTGVGYHNNEINIKEGKTNEILIELEGRCEPNDGQGYFLETGCTLGLVRGYLSGMGYSIDSHSVERFK